MTERQKRIQATYEAIQLNQIYFEANKSAEELIWGETFKNHNPNSEISPFSFAEMAVKELGNGAKVDDIDKEIVTITEDWITQDRSPGRKELENYMPQRLEERRPWSLMIDLETLGRLPDSVIIEIAVQQFDLQTGELGKSLYLQVDKASCLEYGLKQEPETVQWWAEQEVHYSERIKEPMPLPMALRLLKTFIKNSITEQSTVWSNGTDFDIAILRMAYAAVGIEFPYPYYMSRDVRTITKLFSVLKSRILREGNKHDPLSDCKFQIIWLLETLKSIGI